MIRIGMDIGGTKIVIAALDETGKLVSFRKVPSTKTLAFKDNVIDSLHFFLDEYFEQEGFDRKLIKGIGIGVPSVLDSNTQEIVSTPNLPGFNRLPLGKLLSPKIGIPVFVENDVNLIALGEHSFGRGLGIADLACIYVGTGLGCGLILNNQLYTGADGAAAEFGHTIYTPNGRLCGCGGRGCYEMYCSGVAYTYAAQEIFSPAELNELQSGDTFGPFALAEKVIQAARAGHPQARETIEGSFSILGLAITNLVNLLNPRLIILGGGILSGWPEGLDIVQKTVYAQARSVSRDRLVFAAPMLHEEAGLYGAARLVDIQQPA
jgi:glucokinase